MGFVHDEEFEGPDFNIGDIRQSTDTAELLEWLEQCEDVKGDIKAQIEAATLAGVYDTGWMERARNAYGFAGMGATRLKRRLKALGHEDAPPGELERLSIFVGRQASDLGKARASASFGRHLLASLKAALPAPAVDAIVGEAAERAASEDHENTGEAA